MRRVHAAILFAGEQERRRIGGLVRDVMVRGVRKKSGELLGVFNSAKLSRVESPIGIEFDPEHVIDANVRNRGLKQLWMLRDGRAHEETPIAPAFDGELFAAGVVRANQELRAGDEIIEDMLLVGEIAGCMPFLTVLASATQVGDCNDPSLIQSNAAREVKVGRQADSIAPIAG